MKNNTMSPKNVSRRGILGVLGVAAAGAAAAIAAVKVGNIPTTHAQVAEVQTANLNGAISGINRSLITVEPGVNLFVQDSGAGKSTVVFIHGWPVNHSMFEYQYNALLDSGYRVIGIDLRVFGESDKPRTGYNYDRLADDVKVVLDTLNVQNATLIGFSMGGAVAIHYMARHRGAHIAKLVLLSPANAHDAPFAQPLLAWAVRLYQIRPRIIRVTEAQ